MAGTKGGRIRADRSINHLGSKTILNEDYTEGSSGTYMAAGQLVSITGKTGGYESASKAQADVVSDSTDLWVCKDAIWEYGEVAQWAILEDVDTSAGAIGDDVFLSDTAGGWSLTPGTSPIRVGKVLVSSATVGVVWLSPGSAVGIGPDSSANVLTAAASAALDYSTSGTVAITTAAAETNTLAIPAFAGQTLTMYVDTYAVGDRVITVAAAINVANNTIMTFGAASDFIKLEGITLAGALVWQVVSNDGVALS